MKTTLITTFAFALMVFAFNVTPAQAGDKDGCTHLQKVMGTCHTAQIDDLKDPDHAENERTAFEYDPDCEKVLTLRGWGCKDPNKWFNTPEDGVDGADESGRAVADSGNEGDVCSASAGDQ